MNKSFKSAALITLCFVLLLGMVTGGVGETNSPFCIKAKAFNNGYNTGDIIQFGSYPQTRVKNEETLKTLNQLSVNWVSYGYYSGTGNWRDGKMTAKDFMKYADVDLDNDGTYDYRAVKFTEYRPTATGDNKENTEEKISYDGLPQVNNGYYVGQVYWFKYDPIYWRILDPDESLLMCENIIDSQPYSNYLLWKDLDNDGEWAGDSKEQFNDKGAFSTDWETSSLRKWLEEDFYNTAFSADEKSQIKERTNQNKSRGTIIEGGTSCSDFDGEETKDKVFLLSFEDIINSAYGFSDDCENYDKTRLARGSDYAKCQGLEVGRESWKHPPFSDWRLRTSYNDSYVSCFVNSYSYSSETIVTSVTTLGIRPAVCLKNLNQTIVRYKGYFNIGTDSNNFSHTSNNFPDGYSFSNGDYLGWLTWYNSVPIVGPLYDIVLATRFMGWDGSCHGIATTLCLAHQGYIDIDSINCVDNDYPDCYYDLGISDDLRDMINFYQLLQDTTYGQPTKSYVATDWHFDYESDFNSFLSSFVNEAKRSESEKKPFILTMGYNHSDGSSGGHSIVVCGYNFNEETRNHEILVYDENTYSYFPIIGRNNIIYISENCSSIDCTEVLGITTWWYRLGYWSIDKIYNEIPHVQITSKKMRSASSPTVFNNTETYAAQEETESDSFIADLSFNKRFKLTNAAGKWISFDGQNYKKTMEIVESGLVGSAGNEVHRIKIGSSSKYVLTDMDDDFRISFNLGGETYSLSGKNIDSIEITESRINIKGKNQDIEFWKSCGQEFTRVQGYTKGDVVISLNNETTITPTDGFDNVVTSKTNQLIFTDDNSNHNCDGVVIDSNGETEIITKNIPSVSIKGYTSTLTVDYKSTLIFHAVVENGDSSKVVWLKDGKPDGSGVSYTIEDATSSFSIQAQYSENDNKYDSKIENVSVKSGFFQKLIAFFRNLFNKLPVWEDNVKK